MIVPIDVVVANRARTYTWQTLCDFCKNCVVAMTAEAVTFPAPPVSMADWTTDNDAFQVAIVAWGALGNRGSHADYVNLQAAAQQCINDLQSNADYVQSVARASFPGSYSDQVSIVLLAGMRAKSLSNRLALWGVVNDLRQIVSQNLLGTGFAHLRWSKPNVPPGAMSKPNGYNIYSSGDNIVYSLLTSVTSTSYVAIGSTGGNRWYQIAPISAAGEGARSSGIQVYYQ